MFGKSLVALASLALLGVAPTSAKSGPAPAIAPDRDAWLQTCEDWDEWDKPGPPYQIYGGTFYVGTCGISAILIVGRDGLVLIDSGTEAGAQIVTSNIANLGFHIEDVRALLVSHEHFDHVGGMARLQQLSGATIYAGWGASPVIRSGQPDPLDPQASSLEAMAPVPGPVRSVRGGERGILAGIELVPIATPGHTRGALSWQWRSCENELCRTIVYADSLSAVASGDFRFLDDPELVREFRASLARIAAADCDILITPHPSASNMPARLSGEAPWEESGACKAYANAQSKRLDQRLAEEAKAK